METVLPTVAPEESIPIAYVPWNRDDDRARYLGLRASGFTIMEALGLIGKSKSALSTWRHDDQFADLEKRLPELRSSLAMEYPALWSLRNYALVMEKDFRVLMKSLNPGTKKDEDGSVKEVPMSSQDFSYLLKLRQHYTPQQLQTITNLFGVGSGDEDGPTGWTDMVLMMQRTTETETRVVKQTRQRQESNLGPSTIVEVKPYAED